MAKRFGSMDWRGEPPRKFVIPQGDYTPEEIAKLLLYATSTGRDMPPDRNLAAARKLLVRVNREGLYTNLKSLPASEEMLCLAAYHLKREAQARGKKWSDYTAICKLAETQGGKWSRTLNNWLKARGGTLEGIAHTEIRPDGTTYLDIMAVAPASSVSSLPTSVRPPPKK